MIAQNKNNFNFTAEKKPEFIKKIEQLAKFANQKNFFKTKKAPPHRFKPEKSPTDVVDKDIEIKHQQLLAKIAEQKDVDFLIKELKKISNSKNQTDNFDKFLTKHRSRITSFYHCDNAEDFKSFKFIKNEFERDSKLIFEYRQDYSLMGKPTGRQYFKTDGFDDGFPHFILDIEAKHEKVSEPKAFIDKEVTITGTAIIKNLTLPTEPINNTANINLLNFFDKITDDVALKFRTEKAIETRAENKFLEQEAQRKAERINQLNPEIFENREQLARRISNYFLTNTNSDKIEVLDKKAGDKHQHQLKNSNYLFRVKNNLLAKDKKIELHNQICNLEQEVFNLQQEISDIEKEIFSTQTSISKITLKNIKYKNSTDKNGQGIANQCEEIIATFENNLKNSQDKIITLRENLKPLQENLITAKGEFNTKVNYFYCENFKNLSPLHLKFESIIDNETNEIITYVKPNIDDDIALEELEKFEIINTENIKFSKPRTTEANKKINHLRGVDRIYNKLLKRGAEYGFDRFLTLTINKQIDINSKIAQQIKLDFIHKTLQPGSPFYFSKYCIFVDNTASDAMHFHILYNSTESKDFTIEDINGTWSTFLQYYEVTRDGKIIKRETLKEVKDDHLRSSEKGITITYPESSDAKDIEDFLNDKADYLIKKLKGEENNPHIRNKSDCIFVGLDKRFKYFTDKYSLSAANLRIAILEAYRSMKNGEHLTYNIFDKIQKQQYSELLSTCNFEFLEHTITDIEFIDREKSKSDGIIKFYFKSTFKISELKSAINASQTPPFT